MLLVYIIYFQLYIFYLNLSPRVVFKYTSYSMGYFGLGGWGSLGGPGRASSQGLGLTSIGVTRVGLVHRGGVLVLVGCMS